MARLLLILICLWSLALQAQSRYPQDYFRLPMNITPYLSGNFGEPRSTHFHTGLDIKTDQHEDLPILASADGYVARIVVGTYGYGRVLYIQHPNGFTTVYAHLNQFSDSIQAYVNRAHYKNRKFKMELFPKPGELPVVQGEMIAYSGNTGGSGGPHLHFEIRDENQAPLNPLLFGIDITDRIKPSVGELTFYHLGENRFFHESVSRSVYDKGGYWGVSGDTILINAEAAGLGVHTWDKANGAANRNGVYSIQMMVDGEQVYEFVADRIPFSEYRYSYSHTDHRMRHLRGRISHNCYVQPGNHFSGYKTLIRNGKLLLSSEAAKEVEVIVSDYEGNNTRINFWVRRDDSREFFSDRKIYFSEVLPHDRYNEFKAEHIKLGIPKGCLFDTLHFNYGVELSEDPNIYSHIHYLHDDHTPLFKNYSIAIRTRGLPMAYRHKALIVRKDWEGDIISEGGHIEGEYMLCRSRYLGTYWVTVDTTAPRLRGRNIYNGKNMRGQSRIRISASDNLSGIDEINGYIDGEWVLFEYEHKKNELFFRIPPDMESGEHSLELVVSDELNNESKLQLKFNY